MWSESRQAVVLDGAIGAMHSTFFVSGMSAHLRKSNLILMLPLTFAGLVLRMCCAVPTYLLLLH